MINNTINTEVVNVEDISPSEYNPRTSTKKGRTFLGNSLEEFGYVDPIIVNKRNNKIVGGHQRYSHMLEQNVKTVEVVMVNLDDKEEKALNIALNKTGEHFEWDTTKLNSLLEGFDGDTLESIGFSEDDIIIKDTSNDVVEDWKEDDDLKDVIDPVDKQFTLKKRVEYNCPSCSCKFEV